MSERDQIIREVAATMQRADEFDPEGGRSRAAWETINAAGWTVDLPAPLGHDRRCEGVILTAAELDRACDLAHRLAPTA